MIYSLISTKGNRPEKLKQCMASVDMVSEKVLVNDTSYGTTTNRAMTLAINHLIPLVPDGEWFLYLADDEILEGNPLPYLEKEKDFLTVWNRAANPANEGAVRYDPAAEKYLYTRFVKKAPDTRFVEFHWMLHHDGLTRNHYNAKLSSVIPGDVIIREEW